MAFRDLRAFIAALENAGELFRVRKQADPKYEMAAVMERTIAEHGPILLFENVEGSEIPLLGNPFLTRRLVAFALGWEEKEVLKRWVDCLDKPVPPVVVASGPCKEVRVPEPDLTKFPVPITWHDGDHGPYITFAQVITKDPETGRRNVGIYRIEIVGPQRLAISIAPTHHGSINIRKSEMMGVNCEFALAIGTEPACYLATQATVGHGEDEYGLAGALRGEPIELVQCETVDLQVPAHAEIIIEGKFLSNVREDEGPFGEWTGFVSGRSPHPVAEVTYMSHRKDPIYQVTYEGFPVYGPTNIMQQVAREPEWFRVVRSHICPTISDLHIPIGGCALFIVIVAIKKTVEGIAKNVILDILREPSVKLCIVVDSDIDIRNFDMVQWALSTRMQPASDLILIPEAANNRLDPSQPHFPSGVGSKMGIDATWPLKMAAVTQRATAPKEVAAHVASVWQSYGIPRR